MAFDAKQYSRGWESRPENKAKRAQQHAANAEKRKLARTKKASENLSKIQRNYVPGPLPEAPEPLDRTRYVFVRCDGHPRADPYTQAVAYHVLVAEKALGRYLPGNAPVHHFNNIRSDNRNENLVICQDPAYHQLLHRRQRILAAGGNPNTDKICSRCHSALPMDCFGICRSTHDGLSQNCLVCTREIKTAKRRAQGKPIRGPRVKPGQKRAYQNLYPDPKDYSLLATKTNIEQGVQ